MITIIAGKYKGRKLTQINNNYVRPTQAKVKKSIFDTLSESDAAILITGHKEFQNLDLKKFSRTMKNPVLIDCTGLVKPLDAKENGFIFRGIGRGGI